MRMLLKFVCIAIFLVGYMPKAHTMTILFDKDGNPLLPARPLHSRDSLNRDASKLAKAEAQLKSDHNVLNSSATSTISFCRDCTLGTDTNIDSLQAFLTGTWEKYLTLDTENIVLDKMPPSEPSAIGYSVAFDLPFFDRTAKNLIGTWTKIGSTVNSEHTPLTSTGKETWTLTFADLITGGIVNSPYGDSGISFEFDENGGLAGYYQTGTTTVLNAFPTLSVTWPDASSSQFQLYRATEQT